MKNIVLIFLFLSLLSSCSSTRKISSSRQTQTSITTENDGSSSQTSITTENDGSSFEKAIVINENTDKAGVDAEYEWLRKNYPGCKLNGQSLTQNHKVPYDIINIITADGQSKAVYFNISKFFPVF